MPRSIYLKILLGLITIVGTLAYWEFGVRILANAAFPLLRTDPDVGSIHVANFDGNAWDEGSRSKHHIYTNSLGYIGKDVEAIKPRDVVRIAMLGDSIVEGLQVDTDSTFPLLLESNLNNDSVCPQSRFEVMNFGVGGTGTFMQYQTFKKKIAPLSPDYVLLFFHDDYTDNLSKSQFDLEHFASERKSVGLKTFLLKFQLPKFLFSKLQTNPIVLFTLRHLGLFEGSAQPTSIESASSTDVLLPDNYYQYSFDLITKLNTLVEASGATLIVVPYPNEADYDTSAAWEKNPHLTKLIDFLSASNITFWNPAPELAVEKKRVGSCLAYTCADHLNETGHKVMAQILNEYLRHDVFNTKEGCTK